MSKFRSTRQELPANTEITDEVETEFAPEVEENLQGEIQVSSSEAKPEPIPVEPDVIDHHGRGGVYIATGGGHRIRVG